MSAGTLDRLPPVRRPSCGSDRGWWAHYRSGELACTGCTEAHNALRRKGTPQGRPRTSECGSTGGHKQHKLKREPVCEACRLAVNAYNRERYAADGSTP